MNGVETPRSAPRRAGLAQSIAQPVSNMACEYRM